MCVCVYIYIYILIFSEACNSKLHGKEYKCGDACYLMVPHATKLLVRSMGSHKFQESSVAVKPNRENVKLRKCRHRHSKERPTSDCCHDFTRKRSSLTFFYSALYGIRRPELFSTSNFKALSKSLLYMDVPCPITPAGTGPGP